MKIIAINGWAKSGKDTVTNYLINEYSFKRIAFADPLKEMVARDYDIPLDSCHNQNLKEQPLLQYPVTPKDKYALNLSKFLYKEFRSADGRIPMEVVEDASGTLLGLMSYNQAFGAPDVAQLYHTPRSLCILEGSGKRTVNPNYWVETAIRNIRNNIVYDMPNMMIKEAREAYLNKPFKDKSNKFIISDLRYRSEIEPVKAAFGNSVLTVRINRFDTTESTDPSERDLDNYPFDVILENKGTLEELFSKVDNICKD